MKKFTYQLFIFFTSILSCISCTEPMALQTDTFEEIIVAEAILTNELKHHEIKITKTYKFEDEQPQAISNANVYIKDNEGNFYPFIYTNDKYISQQPFQAKSNKEYQLFIINENKTYSSSIEKLPTESPIQDITPKVTIKEGINGIELYAESFDPSNSSKYYRFEYEETYKIIAPFWSDQKAVITGPQSIDIIYRTNEARVCYKTEKSTDIILTNTNNQNEDIINFPVRFISNKNPIISNRYSILIKQYIQNLAAHTYFKTLREISNSGGTLSQNQPGFLYGNLKCESDPNQKIIGFFDVSSVSEKRIFFNFKDYFPNDEYPPYFFKCEPIDMLFCFSASPDCVGDVVMYHLGYNNIAYLKGNIPRLTFVDTPCGDCTYFSSNIKPSFWID